MKEKDVAIQLQSVLYQKEAVVYNMPEDELETPRCNEENQKFLNEIKTTLPSLPRWAKVAFAARCAKRMLPLYNITWSNVISKEDLLKNIRNMENFISIAEVSAAQAIYTSDIPHDQWRSYVNPMIIEALPAFYAIEAAYIANGNSSDYGNSLDETVWQEICTCNTIYCKQGSDKIKDAILDDYKFLIRIAKTHRWTDKTPVHKEIFGEMWPNGKPAWWR